jgi:D-beta-D-heptose 7-phosphate kinase/D-beta-D-heptose 1-phosphate adenosyltransferase
LTESTVTQQQKQYKIFLAGESCIDEYKYGNCDRISPEAPVPVFDLEWSEDKEGMAANVMRNLAAFPADIDFDSNQASAIRKTRFVDIRSGHQLLREDEETLTEKFFEPTLNFIFNQYDAVVLSDYDKGLLTRDYVEELIDLFDGPIFVDSKRRDLSVFEGCYIKVNKKEFDLIEKLPEKCKLIVTLGSEGALYNTKIYPAPHEDVFDVTGAGDVFIASLTGCMLMTDDLDLSITHAVALASKSVRSRGTYTLTKEDIDEVCG